jgi:phosphate transport system substrate-binding protein
MKRTVCLCLAVLAFSVPAGLWAAEVQPPAGSALVAAGSGVNLGVTRLLAEAFTKQNPRIAVTVPGSIGTRGAIKAAAEGAVTFGLISRPLEKEELSMGFTEKVYARVPIVVAVHPAVKEEGLSDQELADIYRGKKTRWKDGHEIVVQVREKSDSGFRVLQEKVPGFKEAYQESQQANRWTLYYNDQEANQAIARTPYAIGVSDLGMIRTEKLPIRALKLNGVVPGPETLGNGRYTLGRDLSFIYLEKTLPKEARAFLAFVSSDRGGSILKANGYLAVK